MTDARLFAFEPPARVLSLNDRDHHQARGVLVAEWRRAAYYYACQAYPLGPTPRAMGVRCAVQVALPVSDGRRRDPHNFVPTVKPIVDSLVDAGFFPDDTPEYVTVPEPVLYRGTEVVVLVSPT